MHLLVYSLESDPKHRLREPWADLQPCFSHMHMAGPISPLQVSSTSDLFHDCRTIAHDWQTMKVVCYQASAAAGGIGAWLQPDAGTGLGEGKEFLSWILILLRHVRLGARNQMRLGCSYPGGDCWVGLIDYAGFLSVFWTYNWLICKSCKNLL